MAIGVICLAEQELLFLSAFWEMLANCVGSGRGGQSSGSGGHVPRTKPGTQQVLRKCSLLNEFNPQLRLHVAVAW